VLIARIRPFGLKRLPYIYAAVTSAAWLTLAAKAIPQDANDIRQHQRPLIVDRADLPD
jgi:hypothetical protein